MAFLYQVRSDGTRIRHWELGSDPIVIGRGDNAGACIEDDTLSWAHFLITREGSDFCVIDLKSRNGTWIDGERVLAGKLRSNTTISAGGSLFFFSETAITTPAVMSILATIKAATPPPPQVRTE